MGPVYDVPREQLTAEQKAASLRYQIMDVVDQIRWYPGLRLRARARLAAHDVRLDDLQEALLGPGAAHLGVHRLRRLPGHRRARGAAAQRPRAGFEQLEGRTQHRPWVDEVIVRLPRVRRRGAAHPRRGQPLAGRRHRALQHAPLPHRPGLLAEVVPGRLHHRVLPGPVPQLVLLDAGDGHGAAQRAALQGDLRLRHALRRGRPADAQVVGQRHRVQRGGRAHGRRRHALDVRQRAARGQHPLRLPHRRRGAPRAARALERAGLLHDLRAPRRAGGRRARSSARRRPTRRARLLDRWILSRAAGMAEAAGAALPSTTRAPRRGPSAPSWTTSRRGGCAAAAAASRAADDAADRDAAFGTLHLALVSVARTMAPAAALPGRGAPPGARRARAVRARPSRCT